MFGSWWEWGLKKLFDVTSSSVRTSTNELVPETGENAFVIAYWILNRRHYSIAFPE